jgi:dethiobiotin synthase
VGKTVLTGLLLAHLRQSGRRAFALKPFCSGSRADARLLRALQERELSLEEINPFFFSEPLAPFIAARKHHRKIHLPQALSHIRRIAAFINSLIPASTNPPAVLLIEGAGGLLAPLGVGFSALDVIRRLRCETFIVSRNQLGTINHTLLAWRALARELPASRHAPRLRIFLMDRKPSRHDPSRASNPSALSQLLPPGALLTIPFLGPRANRVSAIRQHARNLRPILRRVIGPGPKKTAERTG